MLTIENPRTFDWANMSLSDCCEGNAADTYFTLKLFDIIMEELKDDPVMKLIEHIVMPSLAEFGEIEFEGLDVDPSVLGDVSRELNGKNMEEEDKLYDCIGVEKTDNLSSNVTLIDILYTREGSMEFYPPNRTPKGKPSVDAGTLKLLRENIEEELETR